MKRIIALVLCLMMIIPCLAIMPSAEALDPSAPYEVITRNGFAKATSTWNNDSLAKYAVDGIIDGQIDGYQFWRPNYSGRDYTIDPNDPQYIEVQFNDYYVYDKIDIYAVSYSSSQTFKAQMLVLGEWVDIGVQSKTVKYESDKTFTRNCSVFTIDIPENLEEVSSKKIRITVSGYIAWEPALMIEINIWGKKGKAPAWDVPDGAYLSTNAALSSGITVTNNDEDGNFESYSDGKGSVYASSSARNQSPYFAADDTKSTYWMADASTPGEWIAVEFDKLYQITKLGLNTSNISAPGTMTSYTIDVEILDENDAWVSVKENWNITASAVASNDQTFDLPAGTSAKGVKYIFKSSGAAAITEMIATIYDSPTDDTDGKCVFLAGYITEAKRLSSAGGNFACYGQAYASSSFTTYGITNPTYINDGEINDDAYSWFAATPEKDSYCGVRLREEQEISKVVLYFNDKITGEDFVNQKFQGLRVMTFDVEAFVDGEYVTIASGSSFDSSSKKYIISFELDETVLTNDVRVVFRTTGGIYSYLKELEVYGFESGYPQFDNMTTPRYAASATKQFAGTSFPIRSPYMNIHFPILSESPLFVSINQMSAFLYI